MSKQLAGHRAEFQFALVSEFTLPPQNETDAP